MTHYRPPEQSARGQLLDALFILLLLFVTLFFTTYLTKMQEMRSADGSALVREQPLTALPITDAERAQFQKLIDNGLTDLVTVNQAVETNRPDPDRYAFSITSLIVTVLLISGYMAFVYVMSFRQYREVIRERYGAGGAS